MTGPIEAGSWIVGVDIGGTFTDVAAINTRTGDLRTAKVLTDQARPERGAAAAVRSVSDGTFPPAAVAEVIHGTTLAINTVLERNGARVGLVTTKGFRDVIEIGNGNRYDIYDLQLTLPPPLIPRRLRFEVGERTGADGTELAPLDHQSVDQVARALRDARIEAVAVCFLHSYANNAHELAVAEILAAALPGVHLSLSSEVAPIVREYERSIATAVNAYIGPVAAGYLGRLSAELATGGFTSPISIMQSDGGTCTPQAAASRPAQILESGPAAGVLAMARVAFECNQTRAVAFDMGGTTAKACLVIDGRPGMTGELEVGRHERFKKGSGLPVRLPSIDLVEVGAGGNSIAHRGPLGLLAVGPASADSTPGPACYGLGGDQPTVTDADLVLGYLDPSYFAGGSIQLDADAAYRCVAANIAGDNDRKAVIGAAWAIYDLVNETMALAIRLHCIEHGVDPAEVTVIATGGAGPVHVASVMSKLGVSHAICPPNAGVASAVGLAMAPQSFSLVASDRLLLGDDSGPELQRRFEALVQRARHQFPRDDNVETVRWLELRVEGQGHEIRVDMPGELTPRAVAVAFADAYVRLYGRLPAPGNIEIVNWAVRLVRPRDMGTCGHRRRSTSYPALVSSSRAIYVGPDAGFVAAAVVTRAGLEAKPRPGPLIVQDAATGIVVPSGFTARVDGLHNVHVEAL